MGNPSMPLKPLPLPSQARLSDLFDYSIVTGELRWKPRSGCRTDRPAGTTLSPYIQVQVDRKSYYAHRVIWMLVTGQDPGSLEVDHKDLDGRHNAWHNLRLADHHQNMQNTKIRSNNKLGFKGVSMKPSGKYIAEIKVRGERTHLGTFLTAEEASAAYADASARAHGSFGRAS